MADGGQRIVQFDELAAGSPLWLVKDTTTESPTDLDRKWGGHAANYAAWPAAGGAAGLAYGTNYPNNYSV